VILLKAQLISIRQTPVKNVNINLIITQEN